MDRPFGTLQNFVDINCSAPKALALINAVAREPSDLDAGHGAALRLSHQSPGYTAAILVLPRRRRWKADISKRTFLVLARHEAALFVAMHATETVRPAIVSLRRLALG
jgi:hypothetical protein